jgi:hypothetical protein
MKKPRNTGSVFNNINRLERQMGVDVGLRDTAEHLYRPAKRILTLPLTPTVIRRQNAARYAATN